LGLHGSLDAETLTKIETLSGHRGRITALAISPNGDKLASQGSDGTIRFWDVSKVVEK
jgi:WD40 repeat protein